MVGSCDVKFPIRLEGLHYNQQPFSQYEPEMFPGILDLGLIMTRSRTSKPHCRPTHAVCHALIRAHVHRMLIGACNPMSCPILFMSSGLIYKMVQPKVVLLVFVR